MQFHETEDGKVGVEFSSTIEIEQARAFARKGAVLEFVEAEPAEFVRNEDGSTSIKVCEDLEVS